MATENLPYSAFQQPSWTTTKYALDLSDVFSFTFVATQDGGLLVSSMVLGTIQTSCLMAAFAASPRELQKSSG